MHRRPPFRLYWHTGQRSEAEERRIWMEQSLLWAALGTLFTFTMTALGAGLVFFLPGGGRGRSQRGLLGFAAGVMTASSVWSLLLPAIDRAEELGLPGWVPAAGGMLAGTVFLAALEELLSRVRRGGGEGSLLMAAITLHNIPEGMAVGLAFALAAEGESFGAAVALAMGVGLQNCPEGAAVSLPMAEQGRGRAFLRGVASGVVEPLFGVAVVAFAAAATPAMPWLLSFAAGAMLYVVVEELIPQAHSRLGTCGFVAGFLVMMVLDVALG